MSEYRTPTQNYQEATRLAKQSEGMAAVLIKRQQARIAQLEDEPARLGFILAERNERIAQLEAEVAKLKDKLCRS